MTVREEIKAELLRHADAAYRDFQGRLIPSIPRDTILGVRTPILRKMAKIYSRREDIGEFLADLPHPTFDENQLHAFIISEERDFDVCLSEVDAFLPYVDNWATCDQLSPRAFGRRSGDLLPTINRWLGSGRTYTVRFGIGMLMRYYLDVRFEAIYLAQVAAIRSDEYYINMMIAWYFATALAKQYEDTIPYLEEHRLSPFVHAKSIQKAIESYRISEEKKGYLRSLKGKGNE